MKKNKILIATLIMLLLGIFCYTKTVEATNFSIYDPRTDQHYQVQVDSDIYYPPELKMKLSIATGLPENLFLFDVPIFYTHQDNYDLELPINQVTKDGVLYNIYHNQEVVVAGLADDNLETQEVVIASEINHQKVTKIGTEAFENTKIRSVTFEPNSAITRIGYNCFCKCRSLQEIVLPSSLTSIGDACFDCCRSLTSITLPNSLTSVGDRCFECCSSLKEITLPNSLTSIGDRCFECCDSLTSLTLPNSLTSVGDCCFEWCSSLTSITLPNSLTSIGDRCFACCRSLTSLTLPNSLTSVGGGDCFACCRSLKEITLPNSLTYIGSKAFCNCTSLQQVNLGTDSKLQDLEEDVFIITKIDEQKFRDRLNAIHQFQRAEKRRADRLASMINLTDQKYNNELRNIYSLLNRHCSLADLIFAYDALTRKVSTERGEDNPDLMKLKQRRTCYCESLQRMDRERTLDLMKVSRLE